MLKLFFLITVIIIECYCYYFRLSVLRGLTGTDAALTTQYTPRATNTKPGQAAGAMRSSNINHAKTLLTGGTQYR